MASPQNAPQSRIRSQFSDLQVIDLYGERGRNRTYNLLIKSPCIGVP